MIIALTGDVMLGRLVDQHQIRNPKIDPAQIWGDLLPAMLAADLRIINLECVISDRGERWRPDYKVFHFRAHPRALQFLKAACIDCVALANNHILDYDTEALTHCLDLIDEAGIKRAGAGRNIAEALLPAIAEGPDCTVAVISLTDDQPSWEAALEKPGVNFVAYTQEGLLQPYLVRMQNAIAEASAQADIVIVSAHVGPNWGPPSAAMIALAHQLIDLGADLYWGHSNHTCQGIEKYNDKFIMYSTGDFIDDYMVDPVERNDLSFLFYVFVTKSGIHRIDLIPCAISRLGVRCALADEAAFLKTRMKGLCSGLGSATICDPSGTSACLQLI